MRSKILCLLSLMLFIAPITVSAGDIDSPGPPSSGSGMYTVEDIYNYLIDGTEPVISSAFMEPTAGPGATMKSTKDIYDDTKAKFDSCDATPDQVMDMVKFFSTDAGNWGPKSGSLTTRSASNTTVSQPAGYYDAFDLSAVDTDLVSGNIKSGITLFGVAGDTNVVDTNSGDAAAGHIKSGKKAWVDGAEVTGTIATQTLSDSSTTVAAGYYAATTLDGVDTDLVSGNIKSAITLFGVAGDTNVVDTNSGDAASGDILSSKKAWVDGSEVTGGMTNVDQQNITPGSAAVTITQGYHNGTGQVEGDADLAAGNIKSGVTIFGVTGQLVDGSNATRVPKTGQNGCWDGGGTSKPCTGTGQDGEYQLGVLPAVTPSGGIYGSYTVYGWGGVRFTDNLDGTVTDNLTGLIWLKNANCFGTRDWSTALSDCNSLASGSYGLTDGSSAGDWRLPNINELHSLVDPTQSIPALPTGHPFTGWQSGYYWSSTAYESNPDRALVVYMDNGDVRYDGKAFFNYVWPVRSGN